MSDTLSPSYQELALRVCEHGPGQFNEVEGRCVLKLPDIQRIYALKTIVDAKLPTREARESLDKRPDRAE